jgi:hypothetical protein
LVAGRIDPIFVLSLVRQESAFDHNARSIANARGLMQILPSKSGKNARNNVDVVFTMMYVKNANVILKHCELTYEMIADYPIYVFGLSFGSKCNDIKRQTVPIGSSNCFLGS